MQPVIEAKNLHKHYQDFHAVNGISFQVMPGQCFGILGPNGAGKTTTLRMILGLTPITSGELSIFSKNIETSGPAIRTHVGVIPQDDNLDPDFSVEENLFVYGSYFRIPAKILRERIKELLAFTGLQEKARQKTDQLSGGMKRRLAFARALINDPQLIILDEPTTGLDPQLRHVIWSKLRTLIQHGKTLLLTTHYMEEAERLCDELIILHEGSIIEQGAPAELVSRHISKEVLEFRSVTPEIENRLRQHDNLRLERIGDTLYCYGEILGPLMHDCQQDKSLVYLHRPGNLEDVFLKLTGVDLGL